MVLYNCEYCNYTTSIKTHYYRHNSTKKHLKNIANSESEKSIEKVYFFKNDRDLNKKKTKLDREKFLVDILMNLTSDNLSTKDCNHYFNINLFNDDFLNDNISEKTFLNTRFNENFNLTQKSQAKDIFEVSLPRNLKYCDRLSMKNGIEARVPFLDT